MSIKIITNKTLKEYQKKYRHNTNLIKVKKAEVESFDSKHKSVEKNYLLKNRNWWLIDGTYYEVPKPIGINWIKNLNKGVQIGVCALLVLAAGGTTGCFVYRNKVNNTIVVDSDSSKNIEITSITTNDKGDKIINVKGKAGTTLINSIEVYKGKDKLVMDEEYIYTTANTEDQAFIITVYKNAFNKHSGALKIVSINQKQIVVKPGVVNLKLGEKIHFETYLDDGTKIDDCSYVERGVKCLEAEAEDDTFKAVTVGQCELVVSKFRSGYAKAIVPVTVTSDKEIVLKPVDPLPAKVKIGEDFVFEASIDGMPEAKFEFLTAGGVIKLTPDAEHKKVTAHTLKSGLAVIYCTCDPYYKFYSFVVEPVEISGPRHIDNNTDTTTEPIQFTATNAGYDCTTSVTWSLENIDTSQASIEPSTGKLTLTPSKITGPISFFVVATKESEVRRYNVIIASFKQLKFEVNRRSGYYLVESAVDDQGKKTATGDIYIPTSYYDEYLGYLPVVGFVSDQEQQTGAFTGCTGITSVVLTNNINSLGSYTFKGCTGLTSLTIPNSVSEIGKGVIEGSGVTGVTFTNTTTPWIIGYGGDKPYKGFIPSTNPADNVTALNENNEKIWIQSNLSIYGNDTVVKSGTTKFEASEDNVTWSVDNDALATIDQEGNLTAKDTAGTVYVFAETATKIGAKKITIAAE